MRRWSKGNTSRRHSHHSALAASRRRRSSAGQLSIEYLEDRTLLSFAVDNFSGYSGDLNDNAAGGVGWREPWQIAGGSPALAVDASLGSVSVTKSVAPF